MFHPRPARVEREFRKAARTARSRGQPSPPGKVGGSDDDKLSASTDWHRPCGRGCNWRVPPRSGGCTGISPQPVCAPRPNAPTKERKWKTPARGSFLRAHVSCWHLVNHNGRKCKLILLRSVFSARAAMSDKAARRELRVIIAVQCADKQFSESENVCIIHMECFLPIFLMEAVMSDIAVNAQQWAACSDSERRVIWNCLLSSKLLGQYDKIVPVKDGPSIDPAVIKAGFPGNLIDGVVGGVKKPLCDAALATALAACAASTAGVALVVCAAAAQEAHKACMDV